MIDVILIMKNKNKNEILLFFKSLFFKSRNIDDYSIIRFSEKLIFKRGKINSISHFHVSRINQFQLHSKNFQKILKFLFPRKRNLEKILLYFFFLLFHKKSFYARLHILFSQILCILDFFYAKQDQVFKSQSYKQINDLGNPDKELLKTIDNIMISAYQKKSRS